MAAATATTTLHDSAGARRLPAFHTGAWQLSAVSASAMRDMLARCRRVAAHGADAPPLTPLMEAARTGDYKTVRRLLDAGARVDARHDETGMTALHFAVLADCRPVVALLCARGADVFAQMRGGTDALHLVEFVQSPDRAVFDLLVEWRRRVEAATSSSSSTGGGGMAAGKASLSSSSSTPLLDIFT